jgi:hypothetical protein
MRAVFCRLLPLFFSVSLRALCSICFFVCLVPQDAYDSVLGYAEADMTTLHSSRARSIEAALLVSIVVVFGCRTETVGLLAVNFLSP